jgi:hypothetical protein
MNLLLPCKWLLSVASEATIACLMSGPATKKPIIMAPTQAQVIELQIVIF